MEKLNEKRGADSTLDALRFVSSRLSSRPESKPLQPEVNAHLAEVERTLSERHRATTERRAATAELGYLAEVLEKAVVQSARVLRTHLNGKVEAPIFKQTFPVAPSTAMNAPFEEQLRYTEVVIRRFKTEPELEPLRDQATSLEARLADAVEGQRMLHGRRADEEAAIANLDRVLDEAKAHYNQLYHHLSQLWPDRETLVESMFYTLRATRDEAKPAE